LDYGNHPIAEINDHVVRVSMMMEACPWHFHPNSDEIFLVLEGRLVVELENGVRELSVAQPLTVPRGYSTGPGTRGTGRKYHLPIGTDLNVMVPESDSVKAQNPVNARGL
jgi:uncharacterized cupin superfamily protein